MEQFYDYRMTEEHSVVEQAHEIQSFARELEHFNCILPDKFVAPIAMTSVILEKATRPLMLSLETLT